MVDLTAYMPVPGYRPKPKGAKPMAAPKLVSNQPSSVVPPKRLAMTKTDDAAPTLKAQVETLADRDGMPEDEPLRLIIVSVADKIDRLEKLQSDYGSGTQDKVAAAAHKAVSSQVNAIRWRIGLWRWALMGCAASVILLLGYEIGVRSSVQTEFGPMPARLTKIMPIQSWEAQFNACRVQQPVGGVEWCLLPLVTKYPSIVE
jgi:hypothetical protein